MLPCSWFNQDKRLSPGFSHKISLWIDWLVWETHLVSDSKSQSPACDNRLQTGLNHWVFGVFFAMNATVIENVLDRGGAWLQVFFILNWKFKKTTQVSENKWATSILIHTSGL